jgi:predicted DCC family thiol-disulfide oxidoreductase YuxK
MDAIVYYDGDCPFCRSYVAYQKATTVFDGFTLVDLRKIEPSDLEVLKKQGVNPAEGIIMKIVTGEGDTRWVKKSEATYLFSFFNTNMGSKNLWWLVNFLSSSEKHAKFWYPIFYWIRNLTVILRGRKISF